MWLPMKFGVSLATTTPLPRWWSANARIGFDDGGIGVRRRDDLEQPQVARRIEEVRAQPVRLKSSLRPSASTPIGMPEVFELTIDPGRRAASTRASSCCLMSSRSTIASMIQSTFASCGHALVEAGGGHEAMHVGRELRIGLEPPRLLEAVARQLRREIEQQRRECPALAQCSAICAPIVPAPRTATELIIDASRLRCGRTGRRRRR